MSERELKPCPFCGATPHRGLSKMMHDQLHGEPYQNTIIKCPHLCASMEGGSESVVDLWNTRADRSDAAVEAAVKAERERCADVARSLNSGAIRHHPEAVKAGKAIAAAILEGQQ